MDQNIIKIILDGARDRLEKILSETSDEDFRNCLKLYLNDIDIKLNNIEYK